ncbi:MAG: sarcosine oxidase subunit gamma family protein [Tistlia sp.]|uniref:sarcosine oxidase subunit gamma n=1 Tax=Tistlia sp. TaxID=3057121 RepID=UPI0034A4F534
MPEVLEHHSALAHLGLAARARPGDAPAQAAGVAMSELPYRAAVNLRGRREEEAFAAGVERALGVALPARVGGVAAAGGLSVLTLGPDEWLIVGGTDGPALRRRLLEALNDSFASAVEVGQQYCTLRLAGPRAADTLQKGCPLDLDPGAFPAGSCAQSLLSKIEVLIHRLEVAGSEAPVFEVPAFEVTVRRSFADYAWRWLEDAAGEYGVEIVAAPGTP